MQKHANRARRRRAVYTSERAAGGYKDWGESFYPADLPPSGWLQFYATRFPTVEVNGTFYRLVYVRFHGLTGGAAHDYTDRELRPWAKFLRHAAHKGVDAFVYFNNDGNTRAPSNALRLIELVGSSGARLAPPKELVSVGSSRWVRIVHRSKPKAGKLKVPQHHQNKNDDQK